MRSRSGSWRRCGCWGGRRCRDGPRTRSKRRNEKFVDKLRCIAKVKKLRWHTKFGEVAVLEPQYRFEKKRVRPFMRSAKVVSRGCSGPLQRAIVDFAADQPFALARAAEAGRRRLTVEPLHPTTPGNFSLPYRARSAMGRPYWGRC